MPTTTMSVSLRVEGRAWGPAAEDVVRGCYLLEAQVALGGGEGAAEERVGVVCEHEVVVCGKMWFE